MTLFYKWWNRPEEETDIPYLHYTEEEKQRYRNGYFLDHIRYFYEDFPIDLADFKKEESRIEPDFNRFIPGILASCYLFCDTIEDVFMLDESVKEYLESLGLADIEACFTFVKNKSEYITIDTQENVENIIKNEEKSWWGSMKQMLKKLVNHFWKTKS